MLYDVLVLGCGPAGFYSALSCAGRGLSTAVVERGEPGGTGLATGCLPVKMILDRIKLLREAGVPPEGLAQVLEESRSRMKLIRPRIIRRLKSAGVDLYTGEGTFLSADRYRIGRTVLSARHIILATGTEPAGLPGLSLHETIISHKEALSLIDPPEKMTIIGGDVEGIEFASLFSELGTAVRVIEQQSLPLPGYDRDLVQPVLDRLEGQGVSFQMNSRALGAGETAGGEGGLDLRLERSGGHGENGASRQEKIPLSPGEPLLVTGIRRPSFPDGLEAAGVECLKDRIPVDDSLRTSVPHIFAVGDINGLLGMGSMAILQGIQIGDFLGKDMPLNLDPGGLPRAVFSLPEIAGAGCQEAELQAEGIPFKTGRFRFADTWRGLGRNDPGFIKVLSAGAGELKGIWMSGHAVSEMAGFCGPLLNSGAGLDSLRRSLMIHPVLGEALQEACNQIEWE